MVWQGYMPEVPEEKSSLRNPVSNPRPKTAAKAKKGKTDARQDLGKYTNEK